MSNLIKNMEGVKFMRECVKDGSVDLILTDPPYMISDKPGFYEKWDDNFTLDQLNVFVSNFYKKLRNGGTIIIWFDIFKLGSLRDMLVKHKFNRIRIIEWVKTNPVTFRHKEGYLANGCKEYALVACKGSYPTFHSSLDRGTYEYGIPHGRKSFHPCKKPDKLFEELINKHSNEGDTVMDTFLGGGTTAFACKNTNRNFVGCELDRDYYLKFWEQYDKKKYDFYMQVLKDEPDWLKEHKYDYPI